MVAHCELLRYALRYTDPAAHVAARPNIGWGIYRTELSGARSSIF